MFDNISNKTETTTQAVTRTVEKSITPDKVSEMYDKVRDEVERNIIQKVLIETNSMTGIVLELRHEWTTHQKKVLTRFILNGKEYLDYTFEEGNEKAPMSELLGKLTDHYSKVVSNRIAQEYARVKYA